MKKLNFFPVLLAALFFITSCADNFKEGCPDSDAANYDPSAEVDDGSCRYEGDLLFFYGQSVSQALWDAGSSSLTFYVDGQVIGSCAATMYWVAEPNCGQGNTIGVTKDFGAQQTKTVSFKVIDDWDYEIWAGNITLQANECRKIRLTE